MVVMSDGVQLDNVMVDESPLCCPHCGYDIHHATATSCPECGGEVNEKVMQLAQVPWQNRRDIGRLRAFVQTVSRVTFRTRRLGYAISQSVHMKDAIRFRRIVVGLNFLPMMAVVALIMWMLYDNFEMGVPAYSWGFAASVLCIYAISIWLLSEILTGVHTYWFHPRHLPPSQQVRSLALSHYASGPMVLTAIAMLLFAVTMACGWLYNDYYQVTLGDILELTALISGLLGFLLLLLSLAATWRVCFAMCKHVAHRGVLGRWSLFLLQPVIWLLAALFCLLLLPTVLGYGGLMVTLLW